MLSCFECDVRLGSFFFFPSSMFVCFSVSDLRRFCVVDVSFVCDHECF